MTQEDLEVLAGFGAVWERVSGRPMESASPETVNWEELLDGLYEHWHNYASQAKWAAGMPRRRLLRLAEETNVLLRRLQTEFYLETGDAFQGAMHENLASYTPYNLQKMCKNADKLAERLQKAAETCNVSVGDAGERIRCHVKVLKELLGDCLR